MIEDSSWVRASVLTFDLIIESANVKNGRASGSEWTPLLTLGVNQLKHAEICRSCRAFPIYACECHNTLPHRVGYHIEWPYSAVSHSYACTHVSPHLQKGWTSLILSSRDGHCEIMKAMLDCGADVDQKTEVRPGCSPHPSWNSSPPHCREVGAAWWWLQILGGLKLAKSS